uniref:Guanylate cyclase n=1 Tax=Petromyzon marinus TaxID=7757 RepID=A0AAJ7T1H0_PETMA|nr:atrial natriuretic peptide receptor 1-like [Petromyzon marinus]
MHPRPMPSLLCSAPGIFSFLICFVAAAGRGGGGVGGGSVGGDRGAASGGVALGAGGGGDRGGGVVAGGAPSGLEAKSALETADKRANGTDAPPVVTLAVLLPLRNSSYPWSWSRVGPAVVLALERVNADPSLGLGRHRLTYVLASTEDKDGFCSDMEAQLQAVDIKLQHDPAAFLGPGCVYSSAPVARFATHWRRPLVTAGAPAHGFNNKSGEYGMLTRVGPSHVKLGRMAARVHALFGWRRKAMLIYSDTNKDDRPFYFTVEGVFMALRAQDITVVHYTWDEQIITSRDVAKAVENMQRTARVIYVCSSPDAFRRLLLAAKRAGLRLQEFAFLYLDLFGEGLEGGRPGYDKEGGSGSLSRAPWHRGDEDDEDAKSAFASVLIITYLQPNNSQYEQFISDVQRKAREAFNTTMTPSLHTLIAAAFYEGVVLYARALGEALSETAPGEEWRNLTRRMWNRTFPGVTGTVAIDDNGDREVDYCVWAMNGADGAFRIVAVYEGVTDTVKMVPGTEIHWPGGKVPNDNPPCIFDTDDTACHSRGLGTLQLMGIVVSLTVLIIAVTVFIVIRKLKLEKELASMLWRVHWDDVFVDKVGDAVKLSGESAVTPSTRCSSHSSLATTRYGRSVFANTGFYKGNLVAIKFINRKKIELTRQMLFELKHMRDVQNEHLTRFVGACIDVPNICIITEYCPRGSLQDILENESISLDWMFRYSLMHDIVKGMLYLHSSVIGSHGNLKSSNCVVDSRFVLKITDYGLSSVRAHSKADSSANYFEKRLWTAPELLRLEEVAPRGTQKGDVYSFAIILQEIALRSGPFYLEANHLTAKEIVQRVKLGEWPYLRPTVDPGGHSEELGHLMQRCWAEESTERPDFHQIKILLQKFSRESSGTILDNLLSRMEQYANNLEELVEERTQAYLEEKGKAEALLYQILPHSVAEQLKRGETVPAEAFDSVTIYLSDIVGFTAMSAQSTPMQVVAFLNDLYTCFDAIIDNFDVYKVETIGDAYMVVSGLPVHNGTRHAIEVARMALALLSAVRCFHIRHRPAQRLLLRIGIHTGPVCAGVVGLKMPRYCLFGDTVNTASRMEAKGEAHRIHLSSTTKAILDEYGGFVVQLHGDVDIKGKGTMRTYWLLGENPTVSGVP